LRLALLVLIGAPAHDGRGHEDNQHVKADDVIAVFLPELRQVIAAQFFLDFPKDIAQCKSIWTETAHHSGLDQKAQIFATAKRWISPQKSEKLKVKKDDTAVSCTPMSNVFRLNDLRRSKRVFFTRAELNQLLSLYTRQVMRGEWRDYAIDQRDGMVLFSMFRRTQELPIFTVMKTAAGTSRRGDYALLTGGQRIATGSTLADVLAQLMKLIRYRPVRLESG
jgi:hypothetical protein